MQRQKRPFYIIGHNPNTIEEAKRFLDEGANALEPDIVYKDDTFYVSHLHHTDYKNMPTVQEYLTDLKALLFTNQYDLALIVWDFKDTDFDPNVFIRLVKHFFSGPLCDGVSMLMTNSEDYTFVCRYSGEFNNVGVGVDESNISPSALVQIFEKSNNRNFSYADGITTILNKPGVMKNIVEAQHCRDLHKSDFFKVIYTWVLGKKSSMCKFLNTCIDGIMVDETSVEMLKELITTAPYNDVYKLAKNGYNPFNDNHRPTYILTVDTMDKYLAGTDAQIIFTLTGDSGISLSSLPVGQAANDLERGSTTYVKLDGLNLGKIQSLTITPLTGGLGAGWLPERVSVESTLLDEKISFTFNDAETEEWISKNTGPVTKFSSRYSA